VAAASRLVGRKVHLTYKDRTHKDEAHKDETYNDDSSFYNLLVGHLANSKLHIVSEYLSRP